MNSNQNSYTWTIQSLDQLINAKNGDVLKSHTFQLGNIEWMIELYPNGEAQHNMGCFIVLLQPALIPTLWNKIIYCRTIKCNETECSNTGITHTIHTKHTPPRATGWMDETMSFKQFQQATNTHKTITFTITINILQVSLKNNYILHIFKPKNTLPKQETLEWKINNNLLTKFFSAPHKTNGQIFESKIFNQLWCIACDIRPQATDMTIYLQLCSLPPNINKIKICYTFTCNQTKNIQNECDEFSLEHQSSGSKQAFINLSQLRNLKMDSINIFLHIKYLQLYSNSIHEEANDIEMKQSVKHSNFENKDKYKYALCDLISSMKEAQIQPKHCHRSLKINKLKQLAQTKYPKNKVVIESDNKQDEEYFDEIIDYINTNKSKKNESILIKCGNVLIEQENALEIFIIDSNIPMRNPLLIGQRGLKTRIKIPIGTVIGEYFGREFLENEFDDIYHGTKQFVDINEYALSATVEVEIKHSRMKYFTNTQRNNDNDNGDNVVVDGENENDYFVKQEFSIVIDGLNLESQRKAMMIYMNDCRKDINMTRKTKSDEKYQNIELVTVYHNGWPKIFAVAVQNIKANSELLTFYGKAHVGWEQDKLRYESNSKFIRNNIKQVLDKHDIASI